MTDKTCVLETIDKGFKSLTTQLNDMTKNTRILQDELKGLHKIVKQSVKSVKTKSNRPQVKMLLSSQLEKFLSVDHGTKLTKAEVMKSISSYIKDKDLQIQEDRRKFLPNKELTKIFGIKGKAPNMTFVEINKHVSHHLSLQQ
jgi:chromatin remodeling complex protein RSC6